jgi:UDP-perosamine 4-acetyltransferase
MTDRPFIILGGGGHARVVASTLRQLNETILGFTDPDGEASLGDDVEYLGGDAILVDYATGEVVLAMGVGSSSDTARRARLFDEQRENDFEFPPIIHPSAFVAPEVSIEQGGQVMAGAVVQPGTTLAENVIVNTNATIDHDCHIGPHVHVAPGATLSGNVTLDRRVHVGTGASIIQGIRAGARSVVGAGAVVTEDVPPDQTVVGIPAHPK